MPKPARAILTIARPPVAETQSPARAALADAFGALREAEALHREARAPVMRLQAQCEIEASLRATLERLKKSQEAAIADWAKTGTGPAPRHSPDEWHKCETALDEAAATVEAARAALPAAELAVAEAAREADEARARIGPAVADVLREDGKRLVADYWRHYAELESVGRKLTALDQVLMADFPIVHAATGRTIVARIAPDRLSAPDAMRAVEGACAGLKGVTDLARDWRDKAGELMDGVV